MQKLLMILLCEVMFETDLTLQTVLVIVAQARGRNVTVQVFLCGVKSLSNVWPALTRLT